MVEVDSIGDEADVGLEDSVASNASAASDSLVVAIEVGDAGGIVLLAGPEDGKAAI